MATYNALAPGRHTLYAQGEDAAGNWGIFVATTFVRGPAPITAAQPNTAPALAVPALPATAAGAVTTVSSAAATDTVFKLLQAGIDPKMGVAYPWS